jgi:hypothetical protein
MPQLADDHVKAVGPEIDRGNDFRRGLRLEFVNYVICGDASRLNVRFSRVITSLSDACAASGQAATLRRDI